MSALASAGQLRASMLRWSLVTVPGVLLLGFISAMASGSGGDNFWYAALIKPVMTPPPVVFSVVWSALYALMGVALAMVICARGAAGRGAAIAMFGVQLAINLAWSPVFFGMHLITAALVLLGVLLVAVVVTMVLFARVRPVAAWLLAPYLVWALFASVLNWQFLMANPDADGQRGADAATRVEF